MKKTAQAKTISTVGIPTELKQRFRKTCINLDQKPNEVMVNLLEGWIERNKRKMHETIAATA